MNLGWVWRDHTFDLWIEDYFCKFVYLDTWIDWTFSKEDGVSSQELLFEEAKCDGKDSQISVCGCGDWSRVGILLFGNCCESCTLKDWLCRYKARISLKQRRKSMTIINSD